MFGVLIKAFSLMLVIGIGIFLNSTGRIHKEAGHVIRWLTLNLTLPAAVIVNFSELDGMGGWMLLILFMAILINILMITVGAFMSRKREPGDRAMFMLCTPSYNIGCFCLPFVQSFLPALGIAAACMFDVGNSIMCTGCTYAFTSEYVHRTGKGFDVQAIVRKLLHSTPLVTYVVMSIIVMLHIEVPDVVVTLVTPFANANTFCAMLMIGLLFHLEWKKEYIGDILKVVGLRQIGSVIFALIIYFVLPVSLVVRQALVLVVFSPISAVASAFTDMSGGNEGKASAATSFTIILSLIEMTLLLVILGLY